jgi:hypothetical protein
LAFSVSINVQDSKKVRATKVPVHGLFPTVVDEHVAACEKVGAIAHALGQRSNQGIHGNPMTITFQRFSIVKNQGVRWDWVLPRIGQWVFV